MAPITIISWIILILAVSAGIAVFVRAKQQGAAALAAVSGGYDLTSSTLMLVLSLIHLGAILWEPVAGKGPAGAVPFEYNFRYYSLLLVGFMQAIPAFLLLKSVRGLVRQKTEDWKRALRWSSVLLAVNIPLIPVQGFAVAFSAFTAMNLILLLAARKYYYNGKSNQ